MIGEFNVGNSEILYPERSRAQHEIELLVGFPGWESRLLVGVGINEIKLFLEMSELVFAGKSVEISSDYDRLITFCEFRKV